MRKGRKIAVTGRIQVRSYEKDDEKRTAWEIQADEIEFVSSPAQGGGKPQSEPDDPYYDDNDSPF